MSAIGRKGRTAAHAMLLAGCAALAQPAAAEDAYIDSTAGADSGATPAVDAKNKAVYTPADFARFAPRTALDMVNQVPGFSIQQGNNGGNRGLGSARENVLINGERISGKSNDAQTTLARIAASSVVQIEILDGAALNEPGLTGQVANVVVSGAKLTATLRWQPQFRPRLDANWLAGEISTSGKIGNNSITISLANNAFRNGNWGREDRFDANGVRQFTRDEFATYAADAPKLSGSLSRTAANGNKLNVNLAGGLFLFDRVTTSQSVQPGRGNVTELDSGSRDQWNFEGGGDYEFGIAGGRLKFIGVQRLEHSPFVNRFVVTDSGGISGNRFKQTADEGESILRGEFGWKAGKADWQIALEGAYNFLDVDAEFAVRQSDGSFRPVIFGGESTKVNEKRSELALSYGRPLSSNLTLQANLAAEYSALTLAGPGGATRKFVRPKGKVAIAWKLRPWLTINADIQRRVDQLSFFDFASSIDLTNNNGNSGNANLVPPQMWRGAIEFRFDAGRYGNFAISGGHAQLQDVVDQIPLSPTTEGRGNLPKALAYRFEVKGTLQFEPLGWKGAKLDFDAALRRNRVRDPLTGLWRDLSFSQKHQIEANFRYDIPDSKWAMGAGLFEQGSAPGYRLNQIAVEDQTQPFVTAFVEHKDVAGFTVRASYQNLLDQADYASRTVYANRRDGPIAFSEVSTRRFGRFVALTISGTL